MLTAVVTRSGEALEARIILPHAAEEEGHSAEEIKEGPSPIAPEVKELAWGAGSFLVFLVLMRLFLFPRLKKGMDERYALIRSGFDGAEQVRSGAEREVLAYRAQLAELKTEAAGRIDAARQQLETERSAAVAAANAEIAQRRAAAADQAAAERAAAGAQVASAVATVATRATSLAIGKTPDTAAVQAAVDSVLAAGGDRMNLFASIVFAADEVPHQDSEGITTHHWLLPETAEIIYGGVASLIIFGALYKFALPMARKALAARTARIQKELDDSAAAKAAADAEAAEIRRALGDIDAERGRLLADADTSASQLLADGRIRLQSEIAELHARADAEIAQLAARSGDELRVEISRLSTAATERLVIEQLDEATQQALVENFIAKVGAS